MGKFSLTITPPDAGSSIVTIESVGWTDKYPKMKRTITAQYGQPSFATYSFLQNSSSWYGSGITVNGPVHSNNGIRMDGTNLSLVTSAKETYTCGSETGCSPPQQKPGVWGSGGDQDLWQFPVPPIDFDTVSFDFVDMRNQAQEEGLYLAASGSRGYHIVFNASDFDVYRVTSTGYYRGYAVDDGCQRRYQRINNEVLIGTYNLSEIPILFAEDHLWVEGEIDGRITVVAARFPIDSNAMNVWIPNNITYTVRDESHALGLLAQNDIYYTKDIPNEFFIDAALMAQKGKIIRHGYFWWCGGSSGAVKDKLTIYGAITSNEKSYWNFCCPFSGFNEREITYAPDLLYFPPPHFPTSGEYEFISWKEE